MMEFNWLILISNLFLSKLCCINTTSLLSQKYHHCASETSFELFRFSLFEHNQKNAHLHDAGQKMGSKANNSYASALLQQS